eukprot:scaffold495335_cov22-Prasinocladus_malaysianus.AAC.1
MHAACVEAYSTIHCQTWYKPPAQSIPGFVSAYNSQLPPVPSLPHPPPPPPLLMVVPPPPGPAFCTSKCLYGWIGDGNCDQSCNTAACNFDGGDCAPPPAPPQSPPSPLIPLTSDCFDSGHHRMAR